MEGEPKGSEQREQEHDEALRQELLDTGNVKAFIEPRQFDLPPVPETAPPFTRSVVESIDVYLSYSIVVDTFESHTQRAAWSGKLRAELHDIYASKNAITRNNIGAILNVAGMFLGTQTGINELRKRHTELFEKLMTHWRPDTEGNPDGSYSKEQKISYVQEELTPFLLSVREVALENAAK